MSSRVLSMAVGLAMGRSSSVNMGAFGNMGSAGATIEYLMGMTVVDTFNYMLNTGTSGATNNGAAYASNHLSLGAGQNFDVDLPHALGAANADVTLYSPATSGAGNTATNVDNVFTVHNEIATTAWYYPNFELKNDNYDVDKRYKLTVVIDVTSGTTKFSHIEDSDGTNYYNDTLPVGAYTYTRICNFTALKIMSVVLDGTAETVFDATVTITTEEITNTSAYLNKFDHATKQWISIANQNDSAESSVEFFPNGDVSNNIDGWSAIGTGVIDHVDSKLEVTSLAGYDQARAVITNLLIGKTYAVPILIGASIAATYVEMATSSVASPLNTTARSELIVFTATATSETIALINTGIETVFYSAMSVKEVLPISTKYTEPKSGQEWFTTTKALTNTDREYLTPNPNAVRQLKAGETVSGLSFDYSDVYSYYPANEGEAGGAFVQNVKQDLVNIPLTSTPPTELNADEITVFTSEANNDFDISVTSVGTNAHYPRVITLSENNYDVDDVYIVRFSVVVNSGLPVLVIAYLGGTSNVPVETLKTGDYAYLIKASSINETTLFRFNGTNLFDISVTNWSIDKVTASEIQNYTVSCREDYKNQNFGASNLLSKQGATGRLIGVADANTIEFNGDGRRVDTGFVPPADEDWTIELVLELTGDGNNYFSGNDGGENRLWIGEANNVTGDVDVTLGNGGLVVNLDNIGLNQIIVAYDSTTKICTIYGNSLLKGTAGTGGFLGGINSFILGMTSNGYYPHIAPLGIFRVHRRKKFTQADVTDAYNEAVELYTTYHTTEDGYILTDESGTPLVDEQKLTPL